MKFILVICAGFVLSINCSYINAEHRKEEKVLEETIINHYAIWFLDSDFSENSLATLTPKYEENEQLVTIETTYGKNNRTEPIATKMGPELVEERVADFSFNIIGNQAVVKFSVDQQAKSAFLEKKDDNWELICIASLEPDL